MRYWAGILLLAMLAGCGKDASIRLTRPEVEPPKTKRVHFSLTTADDAQVSATLASASQTIEMASAGQRSFDATIGENLQVLVKIPEGFEVKDWNVVPGGNTDFDTRTPSIVIKNIQEDIRVSAVVHRIPPKKTNSQKVYFNVVTADAGDITAVIGNDEATAKTEKFQGAAQRILEVPTGESFHAALKLPRAWVVDRWEVSEGGDANLGKTPEITVNNVRETLRVTAHVHRLTELKFRVRVTGKDHFLLRRGSGSVKWAVYPPGKKVPEEFSALGQEGNVYTSENETKSSDIKSYANGSTVLMRFELIDASGETRYFKSKILLDDHTMVDFDFSHYDSATWDERVNVYDVIGAPQKGGSLQ